MDDKKINLLPENLRFKEEKNKRPILSFNPDFKSPGKKQKFKEPKLSGGEPSWLAKIFKSEKKHKTPVVVPSQPASLGSSISYNDTSMPVDPQIVAMERPVPAKVQEHIQDFVPAKAKSAKVKGSSFWSSFARHKKATQPKPVEQKIGQSALANGLKYNGNGHTQVQAEAKPNIKSFQELNKQAEDIYTFDTKPKQVPPKINELTPAVVPVNNNIPAFVPAKAKPAKIKGPSWWSRFLTMFKRKKKVIQPKQAEQKIGESALSNGLKYNGNGNGGADEMHQSVARTNVKAFQDLNKPAETAYDLNLKTEKIIYQASEVVKAEPVLSRPVEREFEQSLVPVQSPIVKKTKIKGPSWWSRFLTMFKRKSKNKKIDSSALSNGLSYNGNTASQSSVNIQAESVANVSSAPAVSIDIQPAKIVIPVAETPQVATNFDLTQKVNEEIGMAPLQTIDMAPEPSKIEEKILAPVEMAAPAKPGDAPTPKITGSKFHMPELTQKNSLLSGSVDLIPIAARVRSWKQIMTLFIFAIVLSVVILGIIYAYVVYEMQRIIAQRVAMEQMISEVEKKIVTFSELNKNVSTLGEEIKLVQDTLNKHIYWTNFFALLEKYTVSDVYYSGLAMGTNGGLTLSATTKSYDSVAKQLKVFESPEAGEFVTDASITSARQDKDGSVSFQVILTLNQSLFYYRQTK